MGLGFSAASALVGRASMNRTIVQASRWIGAVVAIAGTKPKAYAIAVTGGTKRE